MFEWVQRGAARGQRWPWVDFEDLSGERLGSFGGSWLANNLLPVFLLSSPNRTLCINIFSSGSILLLA